MAFSHFLLGANSSHGPHLRFALTQLEDGVEHLFDQVATIQTMIDGDGSQAAHFVEVTARYGFQSDAQSKAAYEELLSLKSKLDGDGSVTFVNAALNQAFNKFR